MMTSETPSGTNAQATASFPTSLPEATKVLLFLPHMQAALITAGLAQQQEALQFCERRCKAGLALAHEIGDAAKYPSDEGRGTAKSGGERTVVLTPSQADKAARS